MKIRIDDTIYEGTGAEIREQLRLAGFDPTGFPDTEYYLGLLRSNLDKVRALQRNGVAMQTDADAVCAAKAAVMR